MSVDSNHSSRLTTVLVAFVLMLASCTKSPSPYDEWRVSGGTKANSRYSTLLQIDTSNVNRLAVAWTYSSRDADTINHSQIQCNPIIVDGILYGTSPQLKVIALDAATGAERWVFDPQKDSTGAFIPRAGMNNNRGVTWWQDNNDRRIFFAAGESLYALDATTGKPIPQFGKGGKVDLHDGLGREVSDLYVAATSPGIIYQDMIIMGSRVSEGTDAAPGHIRAYDVRTGKQQWIFHTIPQPGEPGFESWDDTTAYKYIGGANAWAGFSLDEKRGLLFAPTGSASFDFYGGKRKGNNLYANCILALDAKSGKLVWHFQTVHHDVWDKDLPTAPSLVTVMHNGIPVDAVAQPTKFGFVFVLNRETGESLFPVEERPVPAVSELKGEQLSPTQPHPILPKPFTRQQFTEADINDLLPDSSYQEVRKRFRSYATGGMFTPPAKQGTVFFPGLDGGAEWGGAAFDPQSALLYVNANEMPWAIAMVDVKPETTQSENFLEAGQRLYKQYCMSCHGANREGAGNAPKLTAIENRYNSNTLKDLVTTGRRRMPALKISDEEYSAIASFVLNNKVDQRRRFVATPTPIDSFRQLPYTIDGYRKFISREGYPAIKPPWGTLNAINLNTGELAWQIPLGEHPDFIGRGIVTGTENYGGPVVTAGGLVFIAATKDSKIRAFHKRTGALCGSRYCLRPPLPRRPSMQ